MRKKTEFAGLVITEAITAFLGLAGNAWAIPISIHDDPDAWGRSKSMGRDHDADDAAGRIEPFVSDHLGGKTHPKAQSIELSDLNSVWPETLVFGNGAGRRWCLDGRRRLVLRVATEKASQCSGKNDTPPVGPA
jgi:hypothetical protein